MPNPLFRPVRPKAPPPADQRWVEPVEKAFSVVVEAGWTIAGKLLRADRGSRYVVFTMTSPDGAVVFWGDPELPLRYVVPAPYHAGMNLQQDVRTWFGQGGDAQALFPSLYTPANLLGVRLMWKRFGMSSPVRSTPLTDEVAALRADCARSGLTFARVDACAIDVMTVDERSKGRIELTTFGGDQPGDTWAADFIRGWYGPAASAAATAAAFEKARATLIIDPEWHHKSPDSVKKTTDATSAKVAAIDRAQQQMEKEYRDQIDAKMKATADIVKQRH